jgi:hypothetical protein
MQTVKATAYKVKASTLAARNLHLAASFMAVINEVSEAGMGNPR